MTYSKYQLCDYHTYFGFNIILSFPNSDKMQFYYLRIIKMPPFVTIFWPGPEVVAISHTCCNFNHHSHTSIFQSPGKRQPTRTPPITGSQGRRRRRRRRRRKPSIKAIKNGTVTKRAKHFRLSFASVLVGIRQQSESEMGRKYESYQNCYQGQENRHVSNTTADMSMSRVG